VILKVAYELKYFIEAIYKTIGKVNKHDIDTTRILVYCIDHFEDNVYVVELNEKGTDTSPTYP
jgi:hypothetical protein